MHLLLKYSLNSFKSEKKYAKIITKYQNMLLLTIYFLNLLFVKYIR